MKGKRQRIRVCEAAFLILLGYIKSVNASSANHTWQMYKKMHFDPVKLKEELRAKYIPKTGRQISRKFNDAELFLRKLMMLYGDTMPTAEGTNATGTKHRKILPYESRNALWREYTWTSEIEKTHPDDIAKKTLFYKVFASLKDEVRLLGCKGTYCIITCVVSYLT